MKLLKKQAPIIVGLVLTTIVFLFLTRGLIRGWVIPAFMSQTYKGVVSRTFDHTFAPVNEEFKKYGFVYASGQDDTRCESEGYEKFGVGIYCNRGAESNDIVVDEAFKTEWAKNSPMLEKYLLDNGWQVLDSPYPENIENILTASTDQGSVGVDYYKNIGKTRCEIVIVNHGPQYLPNEFYALETCSRTAAIFGYER